MQNIYQNFLELNEFFYLIKSEHERYIITEEFILDANYINPNMFLDAGKKEKLYSESGYKRIFLNDFKSDKIDEKYLKTLNGFIDDKNKFLAEINAGKVTELEELSFTVGDISYFVDREKEKIIPVNYIGILQPAINLLDNLMNCCADSDFDELVTYFDYKTELAYIIWHSEFNDEKKNYFCMALKPCQSPTSEQNAIKEVSKEIQSVRGYKMYPAFLVKED